MTFTLYMVRHGQTILNSYNRLQGWCDSPLTEKGTNDAHSAGKHLENIHFDAAYSSDTTRAMKTCRYILFENKEYPKTPKRKTLTYFREQSFGYFEGNDATQTWLMVGAVHGCRTYNDLLDKYSLAATRDLLHEVDPFKDAERDEDYWARIDEGFDWLRKHHHDGEKFCWSATASRFAQSLIVMPPSSGQPKTVQEMVPSQNFPFRMTMLKSNTTIIIWITKHTD